MNQGLGITLATLALVASSTVSAQIYKVVDENGNVTYTDQAPADGSAPMDLPELSVVDTDYESSTTAGAEATEEAAGEAAESEELTPRDLRRMYHDFSISQPAPEQTFWGTANTVVISWGSSTPLQSDLQVRVFIDGVQQPATQSSTIALTLDRGEHSVYAELLDSRGRRLVTTSTVTFFVKQQAVGFIAPNRSPVSGR